MEWSDIDQNIRNEKLNAGLAWLLSSLVALIAAGSLFAGNPLWAGFATSIIILTVLPAVFFRSLWVMVPWEVLLLAVLPIFGYAFGQGDISDFAMYLSVAAVALLIAVELQLLTSVEMNYGFAILFVIITTMATAGVWAIVRWIADLYLETGFLQSHNALMWEFVASTIAGLAAGIIFEFYFRRRDRTQDRIVFSDGQS